MGLHSSLGFILHNCLPQDRDMRVACLRVCLDSYGSLGPGTSDALHLWCVIIGWARQCSGHPLDWFASCLSLFYEWKDLSSKGSFTSSFGVDVQLTGGASPETIFIKVITVRWGFEASSKRMAWLETQRFQIAIDSLPELQNLTLNLLVSSRVRWSSCPVVHFDSTVSILQEFGLAQIFD